MRATATFLLFLLSSTAGAAEPPAWVKESDAHAQVLLESIARFSPEYASYLGLEGYDDKAVDLGPKLYQRQKVATEKAVKELKARLAKATDPAVKQDLEIMILSAQDNLTSGRLQDEMVVPYVSVARTVFQGVRTLIDPRVSKQRQAYAVTRMKRYAGLEKGSEPVARLARERTEERLGDKKLLRPFKGQVEQDLNDLPNLVKGTRQLFEQSGLTGWEEAMAAFEKQAGEYETWMKDTLLPQARADARLPEVLYNDNLKQYGVDITAEQLIERALIGYKEIQNEMQVIAPLVAKAKGYKATDYRDVIRELKKQQVNGPAILPLFEKRLAALEDLIRKHNVVTLPARKSVIRLASEAESAMSPAPNMRPPRLIGNQGEYGEFVLPLIVPTKGGQGLRADDYTHEAGAWTLTAHESRPGHELQFSTMVDKGISTARAVFAFNSVNVEGWGLYAEAEMKPYLPLDGQLISLQARLLRAARMFLDPMVNLGRITPEQVNDFLQKEVVESAATAQSEVDRYTYRSPGQATAYYYGYQRLLETRQRAELALRDKFDRKAFNDFVLAQGLLPPVLLQKAVMEDFVK